MSSNSQQDQLSSARLRLMMLFRLIFGLVGIAVTIIYRAGAGFEDFLYAYVCLVLALALNLGYVLLMPIVRDVAKFAAVQLAIDVALTTVLTYVTGGLESGFVHFYFGFVVLASIVVSPWSSLFYATSATALLAAVAAGYFTAARLRTDLPLVSPVWMLRGEHDRVTYVLAALLIRGSALHVVAVLSGALQASLNRARVFTSEILESMSEGALAADRRGQLVFVNSRARKMLSLEGSDLTGRRLSEVVRNIGNPAVRDVLSGIGPAYRETTIESGEDGPRPVAVTRTAIRARNGDERGAVNMIIDLSLRARAELAERNAARLQTLGQIAAGIAHEIRNPLACIRGAVQELREELGNRGPADGLAELIVRESDRLNRIISDFLTFAKAKHASLARCEVSGIVREVAALLERTSEDAAVSVRVSAPEPVFVRCDPEQLKQVFINLGLNGLEATPGPAKAIAIECSRGPRSSAPAQRSGGEQGVVVRFRDWGIGINRENMQRIFDPFFTSKPGGTGLGLCISQAILDAHGGLLAVESEPNKGTTATVWLPAYEEEAAQVRP